jgi:hypothetical protein
MGALSVDITNIQKLSAVRRFGYNLGVAFQLKDDLDDGEFINSDSKSMHELLSFHMKMARDAALLFDKPKLVQDYLEAF